MNRLACFSGCRVIRIVVALLFTTTPAWCQPVQPELPDGFTYIGRGAVDGTDRLVLNSPTSAVLLSIVPNGTEVHRGDLVAAIDDRRLNTSLTRQQTATKQAADSWRQAAEQLKSVQELEQIEVRIAQQTVRLAQLNREQELGENGTYPQRVAAAQDKRNRAKAELELLQTYLQSQKESEDTGLSEIIEVKLKLIAAQSDLRQAEMQLGQLSGPTKAQLEAEHELAVLRAEANALKVAREQQNLRRAAESHALGRKNVLDTLTNKLKEIEEQIAQCQIFAPHDGVVQHLDNRLAQGAPVRTGQTLFSIVDTNSLVVRTVVDENRVAEVKAGQEATICFSAGKRFYQAEVKDVSSTPDTAQLVHKQYVVTVELKPPLDGVRLGMVAQVGINTSGETD